MLMTAPKLHADLLVTSPEGETHLVIATRRGAEGEWDEEMQQLREQAAAYAPGSFFLFITIRQFVLWAPSATTPTYRGDTEKLLERYIDLTRVSLADLRGQGLKLLVYGWLGSIIFKPAETILTIPGQEWLVETGVHPLIYRGYIQLATETGEWRYS